MTLFGRLEGHEGIDDLRMRFWISPVFGNPGPFRAEASLVDVAVLDDQGVKPLRMRQNDAEPYRRTVIMEIEGRVPGGGVGAVGKSPAEATDESLA
jgi:hypothetical protein